MSLILTAKYAEKNFNLKSVILSGVEGSESSDEKNPSTPLRMTTFSKIFQSVTLRLSKCVFILFNGLRQAQPDRTFILQFSLFSLFLFSTTIFSQDFTSKSSSSSSLSSLMSFSGISVTIGGDFPLNGSFPASPTERVDQFVTRIMLQIQSSLIQQEKSPNILNTIPQRGIKIKRADSSILTIDLLKYHLTGDFNLNPYLKNDDVIIFPSLNLEKNFISIYGSVNKPQKFQFVDGDKLSDILFLAQGFDQSYDKIENIEIRRMTSSGEIAELITLKSGEDALLKRGDRIRINSAENLISDYKVMIIGEVKFPGLVAISKNSTTFNDAIKRVGGLKEEASLDYTTLLRSNSTASVLRKELVLNGNQMDNPNYWEEINQFNQYQSVADLYEISRMSSLTNEDTLFFNIDNKLRFFRQSDFANLADLSNPESDISKSFMQDGDILIIPKRPTNVYVFGQVGKTGNIPWEPGKELNYYLEQAGGIGEEAKEDIYLIQGKSKEWIKISEKPREIEPGDLIWVSKKIKRPFSYYLQQTSLVMGIFGSVATVALLVVQLGK